MNLIAELRRRNVIRMAGLYLVGAWLVVQVAATLLPVFAAPDWVMEVLVGLVAAGFIAALVFSWVFEMTPEGLKRDAEVSPAESIASQTARRMDRMIIVVLLLALGYFAVDKFVLAPGRDAAADAAKACAATAN
jgi:pheromone shutdown protein TraB